MAKKVLSIEIGQQVTKAVVIDFLKKNPHVYNAFSFDTRKVLWKTVMSRIRIVWHSFFVNR